MGLYNDAIGRIVKYSRATIRTTEMTDGKLQQFDSKCLREIYNPRKDILTQEQIQERNNKCRAKKNTASRQYTLLQKETMQYIDGQQHFHLPTETAK